MRDPKRIYPIINLLIKIWVKHPDFRFSQLLELVRYKVSESTGMKDWFYVEDDVILKVLKDILKDN